MKKVFIGVLAALMLFAFTACDNGSTTYGVITKITATTSTEYVIFPGTEIDSTDFTFTGYTSTGDPVSLPADQFTLDAVKPGAEENTYVVSFDWGSTGMTATGSVKAYDVEKMEVSAGSAQVKYYTLAKSTNGYADSTQEDADFTGVKPEGLVLTLTYDTDKTTTVTVDKKIAAALSFEFGEINATTGAFENGTTTVPSIPGAYVIQVSVPKTTHSDTYDVTVEQNRVKSTKIAVAENYEIYTNGTTAPKLSADKVYVVKEMSNGQLLKADTSDVKWALRAEDVDTSLITTVATLTLSKEPSTFTVFAKFVGGPCETTYSRSVMQQSFTSNAIEVTGYDVVGYSAELVLPATEEDMYGEKNPLDTKDFSGINVTAKYNDNSTKNVEFKTAVADQLSYSITLPSLEGKSVKDSVVITVNIYNGLNPVLQVPVTATLVSAIN